MLCWVFGLSSSAAAVPVTWRFAGTIETIDNATPETLAALSSLGVAPGSGFSGRLVFESEAPDQDPNVDFGRYEYAILLFEVTIGSFEASFGTDAAYNQFLINESVDFIYPVGYGPGTSSVFDDPILSLELVGRPGLLSSDALPVTPPDLADLDPYGLGHPLNSVGTAFFLAGGDAGLIGSLTQLVPEPGAGALALVAVAAVAWARRSALPR